MVLDNQALVHFMLLKLMRTCDPVRRMGMDEGVQIGMLALVRAAKTYDPSRSMFSTLACKIIRREILREANAWAVIRLPHNMKMNERQQLKVQCSAMGEGFDAPAPSEEIDLDLDEEVLSAAILAAQPRDAEVICRIYGLNNTRTSMAMVEVAKEMGVSRERVRQMYHRGLKAMRDHLGVESAPPTFQV